MPVVKPKTTKLIDFRLKQQCTTFLVSGKLKNPIESKVFTKNLIISETSQKLVIQCVTLAKFLKNV